VPLTVVKGNTKVRHIRFKRNPGPECPKLRSDGSSAASDVSSLGHGPHKRSCLSPFEVTYHMGRPNQEIIELFGSDIGHPDTVVSVQAGSGATFHTSCSLRLQCGQTDASGNFTLTGLLDSTGKMTHPVRGALPSHAARGRGVARLQLEGRCGPVHKLFIKFKYSVL